MAMLQKHWQVQVICSSRPYVPPDSNDTFNPESLGVRIFWLPEPLDAQGHVGEAMGQLAFSLLAALMALVRFRPRLMVVLTNPPPMVVLMACVATILRVPLLIVAMDLYPEVLFSRYPRLRSVPLFGVLTGVYGWAYRSAARVVSLDSSASEVLRGKGVHSSRIVRINNWATGDLAIHRRPANHLATPWGIGRELVLLYSGNLGEAHEWETLLASVERVHRDPCRFKCVFAARGSRLVSARSFVLERQLEGCVAFQDLVPAHLLPHAFGLADLGVVTLREGFDGLVVPSKLAGFLARGIPVLYIGPETELSRLLVAHGAGIRFAPGDVLGVSSLLEQLIDNPHQLSSCREAARLLYADQFSSQVGLQRYLKLAQELIPAPS
ncbi:glycosyltransferase family 4 protein [Aphanothece stagnina]|uniref:glycosyltransferase family 4 protein n=1 Tax=Aphanothece stagnina TaxID=1004305 RepID=UPI00398F873F